MLNENIRTLRKNKGLSQEELAAKLNVVRQTISKWEKGLSVPDAELLAKLAEELEVPVSRLLSCNEVEEVQKDDISEQLMKINEQLVIRNNRTKRIVKAVVISLITLAVLSIVVPALLAGIYSVSLTPEIHETAEVTILQ